jgi:hypothetical protein
VDALAEAREGKGPAKEGEQKKEEGEKKEDEPKPDPFAKPAVRRFVRPDGTVPDSIANAPHLGGPPPQKEKRKAKREREARELEEVKQKLRDQGMDPEVIFGHTANMPNLDAYPILSTPFLCEIRTNVCRKRKSRKCSRTTPRKMRIKTRNVLSLH